MTISLVGHSVSATKVREQWPRQKEIKDSQKYSVIWMKFRSQIYVSESGGAEKAEGGFRDISENV